MAVVGGRGGRGVGAGVGAVLLSLLLVLLLLLLAFVACWLLFVVPILTDCSDPSEVKWFAHFAAMSAAHMLGHLELL